MDPASLYTSRSGLEPGHPTFVGRANTLRDLFRRLNSPAAVPSCVVLGPRRSGKTSLLKQLLSPELRGSFAQATGAHWRLAFVDASSFPWRGFDDFRGRLLRELYRVCHRPVLESNASLQDAVGDLCDGTSLPLLAVIDEFDSIAPQLQKEDQGELRAAAGNVREFGLVIGIRYRPGQVLEYIGDVVSDLAPDLQIAYPALGPLSPSEARQLIGAGRVQAGLSSDPGSEEILLEIARDGHPLLIQAACYGWYSVVGLRTVADLSTDEIAVAKGAALREVHTQLPYVLRALRVQAAVDLGEFATEGFEELSRLAAKQEPPLAEEMDPVDALLVACADLNRHQKRASNSCEDVVDPTIWGTNDGITVRRAVSSEAEFAQFVASLARILYDSSGGVVPPALRGKVKPRFPKSCYNDARSVVTHLICLRNYYIHTESDDPQTAAEHLDSVRGVFTRYAGRPDPRWNDWERMRAEFLRSATRLVETLGHSTPLDPNLEADRLFP